MQHHEIDFRELIRKVSVSFSYLSVFVINIKFFMRTFAVESSNITNENM